MCFSKSRTSNFDNGTSMFAVLIDDHELRFIEWRVIQEKNWQINAATLSERYHFWHVLCD